MVSVLNIKNGKYSTCQVETTCRFNELEKDTVGLN